MKPNAAEVKRLEQESRDFAARVRGDHPDEQSYRRYVLAEVRCARIRAKMLVKEIETIGVALSGNMIDADTAIRWMAEAQALGFLGEGVPGGQDAPDGALADENT